MTNETKTSSRHPTHRIFNVVGKDNNASWTPVGAAWVHADGQGFSLTLDTYPRRGRIVARVITERAEQEQTAVQ